QRGSSRQMTNQAVIESEVISRLRITDEDALNDYLSKNPSAQSLLASFSLSHIFFDPSSGGWSAAEARAESVYARLLGGSSFESLAAQYSEDPTFAENGYWGDFKAGEFIPELEAVVVKLNPGDFSRPVRSKRGIHIIKMRTRKLIPDPKFERERLAIKNRLFEAAFKKQLRSWLSNKKSEAYIVINKK
ncbi:MAG: peptidylprolyl isomerase, partial [Bdellovibrionaceae bacterium]|nr:peptidylprolyl isomerase [Pseudobdellovibrionaceae bacterium]